MDKDGRQALINKLSFIGYYAEPEIKDSVFLAIAAVYSLSEEKLAIIRKHAEEVSKKEATWNRELIIENI